MRATLALLVLVLALPAAGDPIDAEAVYEAWPARLDAKHFRATVKMTHVISGYSMERVLQVWRDDIEGNRERLYARFDSPPELRGLAVLYIENPGRGNDYFLYQPGTDRVRRISDRVASQDIYGIDLEFLGFGIAQGEPTDLLSAKVVELNGRSVVRVVERALRTNTRFDERTSWIDPETLITLRTEHMRNGRQRLVGETLEIRSMDGTPTPMRSTFQRPDDEEVVTMDVSGVDYRSPIPRDVFSALNLLKRKVR